MAPATRRLAVLGLLYAAAPCDGFARPAALRPLRRSPSFRASAAAADSTAVLEDVLSDSGVLKRLVREGRGQVLEDGAATVVRFSGRVRGEAEPFARADKWQCTVGGGQNIRGFDAALRTMRVGEAAQFRLAPEYGYGAEGVAPVIDGGATLDFEVEVLDYRGNVFSAATFADATPLTPRTPQEIKAEFERRQDERSGESDLEGVEWAINKIRTTYLFGFFEGACFFCFAFFIMLENVCRRTIASHVSPSQAPRARRPRPSSTRCSPSRS